MKTVSALLLATLALGAAAFAGPKVPKTKLLDMYAAKEGGSYVVHIVADGDISEFLSDRKQGDGTYKLTLDVPALSPLESKYNVETPFSRRFQVWPMQLGNKIYSRVEIELDNEASSVVGVENQAHLFVRIQLEKAVVPSALARTAPPQPPQEDLSSAEAGRPDVMAPVAITALRVLPLEPQPTEDSDGEPVGPLGPMGNDPAGVDSGVSDNADEGDTLSSDAGNELFFNLFPTPLGDQQTLFNVIPFDDVAADEAVVGIRVGRFALQPSIDASYTRGSNLLLQNKDTFSNNALLVRGRLAAVLLDSVNEFKISYAARYRDFEHFDLQDKFTNVVNVNAKLMTTPRSSITFGNHFVHGAFESYEFDPGGEIVANTDPFYRNHVEGIFALELSERLGGELSGSLNRIEFTEPVDDFFNYDQTKLGVSVVYSLSPLTSLVGEYIRAITRPDPTRGGVGRQRRPVRVARRDNSAFERARAYWLFEPDVRAFRCPELQRPRRRCRPYATVPRIDCARLYGGAQNQSVRVPGERFLPVQLRDGAIRRPHRREAAVERQRSLFQEQLSARGRRYRHRPPRPFVPRRRWRRLLLDAAVVSECGLSPQPA